MVLLVRQGGRHPDPEAPRLCEPDAGDSPFPGPAAAVLVVQVGSRGVEADLQREPGGAHDGIITAIQPRTGPGATPPVDPSVPRWVRTRAVPASLPLPDVATLHHLVAKVVEAGGHQSWGDVVMILATTALRISEVSGLRVGDVDLDRGLLHVRRQTYPGRGGLVTKETKGRRRRTVPTIDPLRPTMERLATARENNARLLPGPRGGVVTTATLRDATDWDELVRHIGQAGLVRHGLRHTALTWMADAGVQLHILQRVAGHQDPAVTARYLHPDVQAMLDAGATFSAW